MFKKLTVHPDGKIIAYKSDGTYSIYNKNEPLGGIRGPHNWNFGNLRLDSNKRINNQLLNDL